MEGLHISIIRDAAESGYYRIKRIRFSLNYFKRIKTITF